MRTIPVPRLVAVAVGVILATGTVAFVAGGDEDDRAVALRVPAAPRATTDRDPVEPAPTSEPSATPEKKKDDASTEPAPRPRPRRSTAPASPAPAPAASDPAPAPAPRPSADPRPSPSPSAPRTPLGDLLGGLLGR